MATNKHIVERLDCIEARLPNGADEFKALLRWKQGVTHAMWLVYSAVVGILVKLIFF
jgi:tetrahydromethanopterin S-methyltransferase subunit G